METPSVPDDPTVNTQNTPSISEKKSTKSLKRKRISPSIVSAEEKEVKIQGYQQEIDALVKYFKEVLNQKLNLEQEISSSPINNVVACLLEESDLPFSKLVEEIHERVKAREGVTIASVRSTVLFVGQRSMYGVANADADVLEDCSDKCLWCWETRDFKLLPKAQRGILNIRRTCRKKIHERIAALSAMISSLQMLDNHPNFKSDMTKASEKLVKVLNEAEIRTLVENMVQKSGLEMAEKESKSREKGLIKELERNKRELEKEKKRMGREQLKEKLQNEKELKRLQEEAEKEERRREKEEAETRKQLKRQQEEAEKDQRRKEKEEAELRKKLAVQKQVSIIERFLNSKKNNSATQDDPSSTKVDSSDSFTKGDEMHSAVTLSMDSALLQHNAMAVDELLSLHHDAWKKLGHSIRVGNSRRWGVRRKPKTVLVKELKLQWSSSETGISGKGTAPNKGNTSSADSPTQKVVDRWEESIPDDRLGNDNANSCLPDMRVCNRIKKLLQFDKSYRPAYYGTLSVKSNVVGPRHPLKKDPNLDYDVESDEEWEEEDPGESLSDCDKDDDEEIVEEGSSRNQDEDGSEDGFLVPDGYLSENEGVQVDSMDIDDVDEGNRSSPRCKQDVESEEFRILFRQQKYINNLTEHALQKSQPLIISNLMHEKTTFLTLEGLSGIPKLEQICLQALRIRPFCEGQTIELIDQRTLDEDEEVCQSQSKSSSMSSSPVSVMLDKDLPKIVLSIQSCSHGINKVVESLQQSFPTAPKSQLRNKVREISEFVDNRWQVKKEILDKLGLSVSPGKRCGEKTKGIAAFFSKRCMPPTGGTIKTEEMSPGSCSKPETAHSHEQSCIKKLL